MTKPFGFTNVSARLHIFHDRILPGEYVEITNEDHIKALKNSPAWAAGELVEGDRRLGIPRKVLGPIKGLKDIPEAGAIAMVATENSLDELRLWGEVEGRSDVLKAIEARYKELGGK